MYVCMYLVSGLLLVAFFFSFFLAPRLLVFFRRLETDVRVCVCILGDVYMCVCVHAREEQAQELYYITLHYDNG